MMNENRIRNRVTELACKTGLIARDYNGYDRTALTAKEKEFARQLVQECINIVADLVDRRVPASTYVNELEKLKDVI